MELDEFITKSLLDIANGVKNAQQELGQSSNQARVNAADIALAWQKEIDFDVAVTVAQKEGSSAVGKGGIHVLGIGGADAKGEISSENNHAIATRLRFTIPLHLPLG